MKMLNVAFYAVLTLCLVACGGSSGGGGGGGSTINKDMVTIGGVEFDKTTSLVGFDVAWTSGEAYAYDGYDDWADTMLHIDLDDGYNVNEVPCIREYTLLEDDGGGIISEVDSYYAISTDGHTYILQEGDHVFVTPLIYFHKDWDDDSVSWIVNNPIDGDDAVLEYEDFGATARWGGIAAAAAIRWRSDDTVGSYTTFYDETRIPVEIVFDDFGSSPATAGGGYFIRTDLTADIKTIDGVNFCRQNSMNPFDAEWTEGNIYNYDGYGDWLGYSIQITLDGGYYIWGVPCVREGVTLANNGTTVNTSDPSYFAQSTDGHIYILKGQGAAYVTPQIYFHKNIRDLGTTWQADDNDADTYTYTTVANTGMHAPNGPFSTNVTLRTVEENLQGFLVTHYSDNLIPLEINYSNFDGIDGYFLASSMTPGTIVAPVGNN